MQAPPANRLDARLDAPRLRLDALRLRLHHDALQSLHLLVKSALYSPHSHADKTWK
ncbi:hypothetical protein FRC08_001466 [Ceratobasidium sp. 394]|nr:hypothetical protein FRC08_001466 [Ceratobasidium sp. 394]